MRFQVPRLASVLVEAATGLALGISRSASSSARTALIATLTLACAMPAAGQFGQAAGFGEMMSPYFLRRDLVVFVDALELDDGQASILETLYWDYEDEHERGKEQMLNDLQSMRDRMKELDEDRDAILELVFAPFEQRSVDWETMRLDFLQNVRAILNHEQLANWERFRRQLRREKELPKGRLSGESVNLFLVLKLMDLEPPVLERVQSVLDRYDLALDGALRERETLMHESRVAMMHSIRDEQPSAAVVIYERQIDARIVLRDTNDSYREQIAEQLPYEAGQQFRIEALQRAYPRVFRPTAIMRVFKEAKKLEDLDPEMLEAIKSLESIYLSELDSINTRLVELIREFEPEEARYRAGSFAARSGDTRPPRPTDPTRAEFNEREELGRRYAGKLRTLLTPDVFAGLKGARRFLRQIQDERDAAEDAKYRLGDGSAGKRPKKVRPPGPSTGGR